MDISKQLINECEIPLFLAGTLASLTYSLPLAPRCKILCDFYKINEQFRRECEIVMDDLCSDRTLSKKAEDKIVDFLTKA